MKSYRYNNPDLCTKCGRQRDSEYSKCSHCRLQMSEYARQHKLDVRDELINYYSNGTNECACCGEKEPMFLSLDHINNDGYIHRKEIGGYGSVFYRKIKNEGFPEGLQVLCFNCNMGKMRNKGQCPHKGIIDRKQFIPLIMNKKTGPPVGYTRSQVCNICGAPRTTLPGDGLPSRCDEHKYIRKTPRKPSEGRQLGDLRTKDNRSEGYNKVKRDNVTGMYLPVVQELIYEE